MAKKKNINVFYTAIGILVLDVVAKVLIDTNTTVDKEET